MIKTLVGFCVVFGILLSPVCQAGFKIGQYELGMSNKRAAKLGLADCIDSPDRKQIRCVPIGLPDVGATTKYVWFDSVTHKLTTMRVESVRFHPFPEVSAEDLWRDAALKYEASFELPLGLQKCGSAKPEVENYGRSKVSTCLEQRSDEYRELKIGYNRVEESGGGHGLHSRSGNTPHVGATVWLGHNMLVKEQFTRRQQERQEERRLRARPGELKKFEQGK